MPFVYVPDNFTISDQEFSESKAEQEKVYRDEGGRQADRSYLDALGHARWDTDYYSLRQSGYSHQAAMQEMRVRIREVWRPEALPALESHPPKPVTPLPPTGVPGPIPTAAGALQTIKAALLQADAENPDLKLTNTRASCFQLLHRAAEIAGTRVAFLGKTADMDGDGKYAPPGFQPRVVRGTRPDGQGQDITIVALSMDALWWLPTMQQVKAIVNSTDGETGGAGKPAKFDSYLINPSDYRWHNPPVAQTSV